MLCTIINSLLRLYYYVVENVRKYLALCLDERTYHPNQDMYNKYDLVDVVSMYLDTRQEYRCM